MDGHDADLVARPLHLALHLDIGLFQQSQAGLQIAPAALLGGQHLGQGFVDGFFRLAAQPVQNPRAAGSPIGTDAVQGGREEGERIAVARGDQGRHQVARSGPGRVFVGAALQFAPQAAALAAHLVRQRIKGVGGTEIGHIAEGAAQDFR